MVGEPAPDGALPVEAQYRGEIKRALIKLGWPVEDVGGYVEGGPLEGGRAVYFRLQDFTPAVDDELFTHDGG